MLSSLSLCETFVEVCCKATKIWNCFDSNNVSPSHIVGIHSRCESQRVLFLFRHYGEELEPLGYGGEGGGGVRGRGVGLLAPLPLLLITVIKTFQIGLVIHGGLAGAGAGHVTLTAACWRRHKPLSVFLVKFHEALQLLLYRVHHPLHIHNPGGEAGLGFVNILPLGARSPQD